MSAVQSAVAFSAPPHVFEVFEAMGTPQVAAAGSILFHEGEKSRGVFVIKSGRVRLSMPGHPGLERIATWGSVLGLPGTISGKPYSLTAEVTEPITYSLVTQSSVQSCLARNPELCFEVLGMLSREVQDLRKTL